LQTSVLVFSSKMTPAAVACMLLSGVVAVAGGHSVLAAEPALPSPYFASVPCSDGGLETDGCTPVGRCGRYVVDNFVSTSDVEHLLFMVRRGMQRSRIGTSDGGPAILDLNSGFLRDTALQNVYTPLVSRRDGRQLAPSVNFTHAELALYKSVFDRIHARIREVFNLTHLYFTAPTFVTRIRGKGGWQPASSHDEYYQPHADGLNTPHYTYSGLLYLSTYQQDFEGGLFRFFDKDPGPLDAAGLPSPEREAQGDLVVEPRAARLLLFTSGPENWHRVERVTSGDRFVFSMWFTCDSSRQFRTFLDGEAHTRFAGGDDGSRGTSRVVLSDESDGRQMGDSSEDQGEGLPGTAAGRRQSSQPGSENLEAAGGRAGSRRQNRRRSRQQGVLEPGTAAVQSRALEDKDEL
jgi:hypothetical protein